MFLCFGSDPGFNGEVILPESNFAFIRDREDSFLHASGSIVQPVKCALWDVVVVKVIVGCNASPERLPTFPVVIKKFVLLARVNAVTIASGEGDDSRNGNGLIEVNDSFFSSISYIR